MTAGADRTVGFAKYHGTGNDFLVVDADEPVPDRRTFAAAHCDRETGVPAGERRGADGVLFLAPDDRFSPPRVVMTLVQPDGSVAEMCGNGARCAAAWAARRFGDGPESQGDGTGSDGEPRVADPTFVLDTPAGSRLATVTENGVEVEMGRPSFDPADVPLAGEEPLVEREVEGLAVTAVNTGVPHAVAFVDDPADVALARAAPAVRHADAFPAGANVTLASRAGPGRFRQRTYERGVEAETRACGTGAVAVAAVARRLELTDRTALRVSPPGGDLTVRFEADGGAVLAGPVERVAEGDLLAEP